MNINFTRRQYKALMELMRINMEMIKECDPKKYKEYGSLIQYILSYEKLHNSLKDNDFTEEKREEEDILSHEFLQEYRENTYWKELCKRLAASRLYEDEVTIDCGNLRNYEKRKKELEDDLLKSFKALEYNIEIEDTPLE